MPRFKIVKQVTYFGRYITWETIKAIFRARGHVQVGRNPTSLELRELSELWDGEEVTVIVRGQKTNRKKYFIRLKNHPHLPDVE